MQRRTQHQIGTLVIEVAAIEMAAASAAHGRWAFRSAERRSADNVGRRAGYIKAIQQPTKATGGRAWTLQRHPDSVA